MSETARQRWARRSQKIYGSKAWKTLRKRLLPAGKLCEVCGLNLASALHHLKSPFPKGESRIDFNLAYDEGNLQPICKRCHSEIHRKGNERIYCYVCGDKLKKGRCDFCESEGINPEDVKS